MKTITRYFIHSLEDLLKEWEVYNNTYLFIHQYQLLLNKVNEEHNNVSGLQFHYQYFTSYSNRRKGVKIV